MMLERSWLAGAGLAIAATLFAVGGSLVSFGLWSDDLAHTGTQRIVLRTPATERPAAERLRRAAPAPRAAGSQPRRDRAAVAAGAAIAPPAAGIEVSPREPARFDEPIPAAVKPESAPVDPIAPEQSLPPIAELVGERTGTLAQTLDAFAAAPRQGLAAVGELLGWPDR